MLELVHVEKEFLDGKVKRKILNDINFKINKNEIVTIMGASGCGKSTLLNIMSLLSEPSSGKVLFKGKDVDFKKDKEITDLRRKHMGLVFQNANLIDSLSPLENVMLAMDGQKKREKMEWCESLFEKVGLKDKMKVHVGTLSGGEAQRVSIVRSLVNNPELLFCDEPTGALDQRATERVIEILQSVKSEIEAAIVIVTHDKRVGTIGDRRIVISGGNLIYENE